MSVLAGVLVATQSRVNGEFGLALGDGAVAAFLSFASGMVILSVLVWSIPRHRSAVSVLVRGLRGGSIPWWSATGGLSGAFFVLSQGLVGGLIGVALFSVAVVAGQAFGAMTIDTRGWVGVTKVPLTRWRVGGSLFVLVGVVIAAHVWDQESRVSLAFVLPLIAGFGAGWQQAVNGRLRGHSGSALAATFINFAVGTSVLALVAAVAVLTNGWPGPLPTAWWLYAGGAVGVTFIAIQAAMVVRIGVLGLGVSLVTGQVLGSILLDVVFPVSSTQVTAWTVVGALITVVGATLVTLGGKLRRG